MRNWKTFNDSNLDGNNYDNNDSESAVISNMRNPHTGQTEKGQVMSSTMSQDSSVV
jgi:hypothetical protein